MIILTLIISGLGAFVAGFAWGTWERKQQHQYRLINPEDLQ